MVPRPRLSSHFSAQAEGRTLTKVVKEYLATYGSQNRPESVGADPWDVVNLVVRELTAGRVGPDTDLEAAARKAADMLRALALALGARTEANDVRGRGG